MAWFERILHNFLELGAGYSCGMEIRRCCGLPP
jgi:hypothetical protein